MGAMRRRGAKLKDAKRGQLGRVPNQLQVIPGPGGLVLIPSQIVKENAGMATERKGNTAHKSLSYDMARRDTDGFG